MGRAESAVDNLRKVIVIIHKSMRGPPPGKPAQPISPDPPPKQHATGKWVDWVFDTEKYFGKKPEKYVFFLFLPRSGLLFSCTEVDFYLFPWGELKGQ